MGALPDRQPRPPARTPDQAPPLQVVSRPPEAAPPPMPPEDPETPGEQAAPDQGSTEAGPQESAEAPDEGAPQEPEAAEEPDGGLDLDRIAAWRTWAVEHLRPPDLVHQASPGLKTLWEQATRGEHLPANALLQVAERARLAVSLPVIAAAVLLAWAMVSPARQAALLAVVGALWVLGSVLLSAAAELL